MDVKSKMTQYIHKSLFLTGFMGSGKSTIGKGLSKSLNAAFIDIDDEIEESEGLEISQIFEQKGESYFRQVEEKIIASIILSHPQSIISLGGGALLSSKTLEVILKSGVLIYIKSEPVEIWKRIKHSTRRPLLRNQGEEWSRERYLNRMKTLMEEREPGYKNAHIVIDRDGKEVEEIVKDILYTLKISFNRDN
jgi:shikimate kinase